MKLLLTSGGVKNTSIRDALVDLLGKPIGDSSALCIPTAEYGLKGANIGVATLERDGWEDRRHGLLLPLPRRSGLAGRART